MIQATVKSLIYGGQQQSHAVPHTISTRLHVLLGYPTTWGESLGAPAGACVDAPQKPDVASGGGHQQDVDRRSQSGPGGGRLGTMDVVAVLGISMS